MRRLRDLIPDDEVLLAMEPEQLAESILQIMNSGSGHERLATLHDWMEDLHPACPIGRMRSIERWRRRGTGLRFRGS
jgi:hypothetical protein